MAVSDGSQGLDHWQVGDKAIRRTLQLLNQRGINTITWKTEADACPLCDANEGQTVAVGKPFPSGAFITPEHPNCRCIWADQTGKEYEWTSESGSYKAL